MASHFESTQMIKVQLQPNLDIKDNLSAAGKKWSETLHFLETKTAPLRVYWGSGVEETDKAHIHIVRKQLQQHYDFLASAEYQIFKRSLGELIQGDPRILHANLAEWTPNCNALGKGAKFTGTAIFLGTDEVWDPAWSLWSTIVSKATGCTGVAGGYVVEPLYGFQRCFITWVAWDSLREHAAYLDTEEFKERRIILRHGNTGHKEYEHVCFVDPSPS